MPLWPLLATLGFLIVFITGVNIILNRGKLYGKGLITLLLVSVPVAVPSFIKIYFDLQISIWLYTIVLSVALSPFFIIMGKSIVKGRLNPLWLATLLSGILLIEYIPFLPKRIMPYGAALGGCLTAIFLIWNYRLPYLNPMWLHATVRQAAADVQTKGRYSPKPITFDISLKNRYVTGSMDGLSIIVKKDKAILHISHKLHDELGSPNLQEFGKCLLERIRRR